MLDDFFYTPDIFWANVDFAAGKALFVPASSDWYQTSPFHSYYHAVRSLKGAFAINLNTLIERWGGDVSTGPVHHILNTGYCCSTLISKTLGRLPSIFSLREPTPVMRLAEHKVRFPDRVSQLDWRGLCAVGAQLLSRAPRQRTVVVKHFDLAMYILDDLIRFTPSPKICFLYTGLKQYLASTLKSGERREWVRDVAPDMWRGREMMDGWALDIGSRFDELSIARKSSLIWLLHRYSCLDLFERGGVDMVSLDCDFFLAHPVETTKALGRFFGGSPGTEEARHAVEQELTRHAKSGDPFAREQRDSELEDAMSRHADEIAESMAWAASISIKYPLDRPIPHALKDRAGLWGDP